MTGLISARWPEFVVRSAGIAVVALGVVVLAGWVMGLRRITTVLSQGAAMVPATALSFFLGGAALLLASRAGKSGGSFRASRLAIGCGTTVAAIGAGHFLADAFDAAGGIDGLWLFELEHSPGVAPDRMAGMTAVNFGLVGTCVVLAMRRRFFAAYQALPIVVGITAWLGLTRYLFGGTPLLPYANMAVHTAPAFLILAAGLLCLRPEQGLVALLLSDSTGGLAVRRLMPSVLVVPIVVGWLLVQGERAGWYGTEAGVSLFALTNALLVGTVVWLTAAALHRLDIRRRRAEEELRALALRLENVRELKRTAIAREIHDVLAQELTRVKIDLVWLAERSSLAADSVTRARLAETTAQTDFAISTVQRIATDLRPVVLDTLGLSAAIQWQTEDFGRRTGLTCGAVVPRGELLEEREAATALFRILQESLTNVARHAHATAVDVCLQTVDDNIQLTIRDDGCGITVPQLDDPHSIGLVGMRERAKAFGGSLQITGSPEEGTTVTVRLPVELK